MKIIKEKMDKLEIESLEIPIASAAGCSQSAGRNLRKRSMSSESSFLRTTKHKSIKKNKDNPAQFNSIKETEKFYLNINKKVKVKPILLETIFEEEEMDEGDTETTVLTKLGLGKAAKRTISIGDGFKINKSLINRRKNQIKRQLGSRKKPKKVALKKFMEDFKEKIAAMSTTNECDLVE